MEYIVIIFYFLLKPIVSITWMKGWVEKGMVLCGNYSVFIHSKDIKYGS